VRPDDEALLMEFFTHVASEDLRFRFLTGLRIVDRERIVAMTQVDYRRSITFLAFAEDDETPIAAATLVADADRTRAELALATRSDMKRQGVSWTLLQHVLRYAEAERIGSVEAIESADHEDALRMERELGFTVSTDPDDPTLRIVRRTMGQPLERGQARLPADPPK
jgi:acetyltransferase